MQTLSLRVLQGSSHNFLPKQNFKLNYDLNKAWDTFNNQVDWDMKYKDAIKSA